MTKIFGHIVSEMSDTLYKFLAFKTPNIEKQYHTCNCDDVLNISMTVIP